MLNFNHTIISNNVLNRGFSDPVRLLSKDNLDILNNRLKNFILQNKSVDTWYSAVNPIIGENIGVETIQNPHNFFSELIDLSSSDIISLVAQDVLKTKPVLWRSTFWIKEPGARRVEWHQDTYKEEGLGSFPNINVWIALDYASKENCLWFIPQTHKKIIDLDVFKRVDYLQRLIDSPDLPSPPVDGLVTKVELQPGECVFFDGRCLHGSPQNTTKSRRTGLVLRFIPDNYSFK